MLYEVITTFWAQRGETGSSQGMVLGNKDNNNDFVWLNDSVSGLRFRSSRITSYNVCYTKLLRADRDELLFW